MEYIYQINSLGAGSDKYGNCEICGGRCDTSYIQTESNEYEVLKPGTDFPVIGLTQYDCMSYIGHKRCLENVMFPNRLAG